MTMLVAKGKGSIATTGYPTTMTQGSKQIDIESGRMTGDVATTPDSDGAARRRGMAYSELKAASPKLRERLDCLASATDLADGFVPATVDSVGGFLDFFVRVQSSAALHLTCSPDGWLCAEWDFADDRSVCLWFLEDERVMFVAQDRNGDFVAIDGDNAIGPRREITSKLIQAGFFELLSQHR